MKYGAGSALLSERHGTIKFLLQRLQQYRIGWRRQRPSAPATRAQYKGKKKTEKI